LVELNEVKEKLSYVSGCEQRLVKQIAEMEHSELNSRRCFDKSIDLVQRCLELSFVGVGKFEASIITLVRSLVFVDIVGVAQ
jgi:hypothetical protein